MSPSIGLDTDKLGQDAGWQRPGELGHSLQKGEIDHCCLSTDRPQTQLHPGVLLRNVGPAPAPPQGQRGRRWMEPPHGSSVKVCTSLRKLKQTKQGWSPQFTAGCTGDAPSTVSYDKWKPVRHSSRWLRRSGAFSSGSTLKPPPSPSPAPLCHADNLRTGRTRPSGGRPWFLLGGDERERLWAELLRTVSPELILDHEEPRCGPEPTEVFTVGPKTFSWTPFPPDLWGPGRSYRLLHGAGGHLESPARSLPQRPAPDPCRAPRVEQQPSVEGAAALRSCPMCQKEFAPRSKNSSGMRRHRSPKLAANNNNNKRKGRARWLTPVIPAL
ncbi:Fanconi anemia core complex-associated protein 20 isoform X2 [Homo sapiens]|uniref:Fanconi anemia core complex-associated protein 20 isoform X2 n=1 Tax=Homo sapiens TaxID=9606 RepID=UPI0005D0133C|nr:Fanconi anemia core complex-associated protein 20 isoform X2 [Homo sapiens]